MPAPGTVSVLSLPAGASVRVDTHLFDGYAVPPYYDSLLAKIIVWDGARAETLGKLIEMLVSTHWMARQTGSWKSLENHGTAAPLCFTISREQRPVPTYGRVPSAIERLRACPMQNLR